MRKSVAKPAVLALASLLATPAAIAASDYILEIRGIDGESAARAATGGIQVESFSWGASQAKAVGSGGGAGKASMQDLSVAKTVTPRDAASGLPTGKRQHAPVAAPSPAQNEGPSFVVNAHDNPNARALLDACASGKHIAQAILTAGGQRYELRDLVVTSCEPVGSGSQRKIVTRTGHVTLMK